MSVRKPHDHRNLIACRIIRGVESVSMNNAVRMNEVALLINKLHIIYKIIKIFTNK